MHSDVVIRRLYDMAAKKDNAIHKNPEMYNVD